MQTLNLKQLEAFCAVVERGSFTAAAEALYLAQSTVSGHILALEKDIGVPLLVRSGKRRITLTEEGRRVYDHAHTILQSCAELSRELEEQTSREVSLAASSIPMQYILPQLISEFHRENPDFRFLLRSGDSAAVHAAVLQGETHIGFVGAVLNTRELTYDCIATDPLVLVTPDTRATAPCSTPGNRATRCSASPSSSARGGSGHAARRAEILHRKRHRLRRAQHRRAPSTTARPCCAPWRAGSAAPSSRVLPRARQRSFSPSRSSGKTTSARST